MFSNLLYILAIAICNPSIPVENCSWIVADDLKRYWFYRPSYELCIEYASDMISAENLLKPGDYARVYCLQAEAFQDAKSEIIQRNK